MTIFLAKIVALFGLAILVFAPLATQAQEQVRMQADQLSPVSIVAELRAELVQADCESRVIQDPKQSLLLSAERPYPVLPSDHTLSETSELWFCSRQALDSFQVQAKVSVAWEEVAAAFEDWDFAEGAQLLFKWALGWVLYGIAALGAIVVRATSLFIEPLLTGGSQGFITNRLVIAGWTFLLGVSNLGFVLALLFIALMTILRMGGFDTRRLLVRLLIAALLINFSLIIAGVLLDFSRFVMAITYQTMANESIDNIGFAILRQSNLIGNEGSAAAFTETEGGLWGFVGLPSGIGLNSAAELGSIFYGMVVMWLLAVGLVFISLSLLVRYIALLLLLVAAPLAYLFLALPNMGGLAKKWWETYLRYLFYGPIAVFILALIPRIVAADFSADFGPTVGALFQLLLTTVFLFLAAKAGNWLGMLSAGAVMGYAAGAGKQILSSAKLPFRAAALPFRAAGAGLRGAEYVPGVGGVASRVLAPGRRLRGVLQEKGKHMESEREKPVQAGYKWSKSRRPKEPFQLPPEQIEELQARRRVEKAIDAGYSDMDEYNQLSDLNKKAIQAGLWSKGDPWDEIKENRDLANGTGRWQRGAAPQGTPAQQPGAPAGPGMPPLAGPPTAPNVTINMALTGDNATSLNALVSQVQNIPHATPADLAQFQQQFNDALSQNTQLSQQDKADILATLNDTIGRI